MHAHVQDDGAAAVGASRQTARSPWGCFRAGTAAPTFRPRFPDLIGIKDRKYIDHTATHQHRGPGDLMRYAALVTYSDSSDFGPHRMLSDAQRKVPLRAPDEALYALAQYLYSLQPPPQPERVRSADSRGPADLHA